MTIESVNVINENMNDNQTSLLSFNETESYNFQSSENIFFNNENSIVLPLNIFNNDSLSALETISKYLKEELNLKYCQIASILNRDDRTIWGAYDCARKKMQSRFFYEGSNFSVPISIFKDRSLSTLEVLTKYLREELNLKYCQIGPLLNRNDRTIWTVYHRAKRKKNKNENFQ